MKYVVFEIQGVPSPVLFPDHIRHSDVIGVTGAKIASAGFCDVESSRPPKPPLVTVRGGSESLRVLCRAQDAEIISNFLGHSAESFLGREAAEPDWDREAWLKSDARNIPDKSATSEKEAA